MPVPRVKMLVTTHSTQVFTNLRDRVESQLSLTPLYCRYRDWILDTETGIYVFDIGFHTKSDSLIFYSWLLQDHQIHAWGDGKIIFCLCSHADPEVYSCYQDPRSEYQETEF